jgi:cyclopropane fatty-acyl-phospholipid synthase-like methyltransferase
MSVPGTYRSLSWTPELVARFWDFESSRHGHYFAEAYGAGIVATFSRHLRRNSTVLDFGCGAGGLMRHLFPRAARVFGMDHSPQSRAEVARRFGKDPKFGGVLAPGEVERLAGQVDVLYCVEVVEHLEDAVLARLLETIRRMLKPDGVAIITTPNREDLEKSQIYCPQCQSVFHRWQHVRSWDASSLSSAAWAHGLDVVETVETDFRAHFRVNRGRWLKRKLREMRGRKLRSPHLACAMQPGHG